MSKTLHFSRKPVSVRLESYGMPPLPLEEVEVLKKNAYDEGFSAAEKLYKDQILALQEKVYTEQAQILSNIESGYLSLSQEINNELPRLVIAISKRVLGKVEITREIIDSVVRDLISEFNKEDEELEVLLHPEDLKLLKAATEQPTEGDIPNQEEDFSSAMAGIFGSLGEGGSEIPGFNNVSFSEDPELVRGDCRVKSRFGLLDGRIATKLKNIEEDLVSRA